MSVMYQSCGLKEEPRDGDSGSGRTVKFKLGQSVPWFPTEWRGVRVLGSMEDVRRRDAGSMNRSVMSLILVLASWHVYVYMGSPSRRISKLLSLDFPLLECACRVHNSSKGCSYRYS